MTECFRMLAKRSALAVLTLTASVATIQCTDARVGFFADDSDAGAPPVGAFVDASSSTDGDAQAPLLECADENKLVYVLTSPARELLRFSPETLTFASIGKIKCPTADDVFSMAVDRRGTAWVEYRDGHIYNVSTKDASCTPTAYRPGQYGFDAFGMGFAKDDDVDGGPLSETLYLGGAQLGRLDTSTLQVSLVGSASHGIAELTGTGAGTLYAFLGTGARIVRLDKTSGAILDTYRPNVDIGSGFAIAQWGGDFFLFTAPHNSRTTVTRYSPATDTSTVVIEDAGMLIIGAGTSTCAPSGPPR